MIELISAGVWATWETVTAITFGQIAFGLLFLVSALVLALVIVAVSQIDRSEIKSYTRLHVTHDKLIAERTRYNEVLRRRAETARMIACHETRMAYFAVDDFSPKRHRRTAVAQSR